METLCQSLYFSNLNMLMQESKSPEWTKEENKRFERALAMYDEKTPDRWLKVTAMIPGKSVYDVMRWYKELEADVSNIEAGRVPFPGYVTSSVTMEMVDNHGFDGFRKRPLTGRSSDQQRKKGVPWTEDEHRRFLMGLQKHGKGDWRNISRNFVKSKTPTQVASHAQKYFIRQNSGAKDKRRPSIHDITTLHLPNKNEPLPLPMLAAPHTTSKISLNCLDQSNYEGDEAVMVLDSTHRNPFLQYPYEIAAAAAAASQRGAHVGPLNSLFQMQSAMQYQVRG
ncbi:unnamed protein product [Camellia sinensis]